ncbi:aminoadipate-semialdehyde dehydrogenase [Halictus rubicundus]|uniref:aminoadipate-semialdehyde dehydrogenase n=1 Tax=Halictus rubicundus TaxID=77578 RepID=UPI0040363B98
MANYEANDAVQENPGCNVPLNTIRKLHDICNWSEIENVAIEYHDLDSTVSINYKEILAAKTMVSDFLQCINGSEFFGIHFDVPEYCVVSLILGILTSNHRFVNIPSNATEFAKLKETLRIRYLFCKDITGGDIVKQFAIHNKRIYLTKLEDIQKEDKPYNRGGHYAYAITTSGSTGEPKVVKVTHASIIPNVLDLKSRLNIRKQDKIAQFTSFTFDPSIIEIFLALSSAGTLFMASRALKNNANRLLEKAHSNNISVLQTTPSVFLHNWTTERLKSTILSDDTSLRILLLGGEPFPKLDSLLEAKHPCNRTRIYNIYGITEVSCWASINEVAIANEQTDAQCLGQALSQTVLQVRNEKGEVVTNGTGSLYIGSDSRICAIDDENIQDLELPVFRESGDTVSIDGEGRLFYQGRNNSIIKRFGNKINLADLEKFALQMDFVKNCYTLWDENYHKLYLCVSTKEKMANYSNTNVVMMERLKKLQPLYRPDRIFFMDHFEFIASGKISKNFLKRYIEEQAANTAANVDIQNVEQIFKSIWENRLKCGNSGFVKLGGESIAALQISNAMSKEVNREFPELIGMLLNDATIDECLNYIKGILLCSPNNSPDNLFHYFSNDNQTIPLVYNVIANEESSNDAKDHESMIVESQVCIYQWHKCRGKLNTSIAIKNETSKTQCNAVSKIEILKTCDLRKCIDASPTVFHYSNGKTYATVGSHSGLISTILLEEETCFPAFVVQLPNRIEASVLILDNFRGIVGCHDGNVYCLDLKTGEIFWKHQTGDVVKCSAIFCEERKNLFVGSYDCFIYCLSAKDGSEIWKEKIGNGSISASGCLHLPSNSVLFGSLDGSCVALEQSSGEVIWKHKLTDPIFVSPVTLKTGLALFCSVTGTLICFDIKGNAKMWQHKINGNVFSYIVKHDDAFTGHETIILASQNKNVYCLESPNAKSETEPTVKYVLHLEASIFATPWCEGNILFVACTDGTLYIYNFITKRLTRTERLPGEVFSSPVVDDGTAIIGCRDNNIYVLKLADD